MQKENREIVVLAQLGLIFASLVVFCVPVPLLISKIRGSRIMAGLMAIMGGAIRVIIGMIDILLASCFRLSQSRKER